MKRFGFTQAIASLLLATTGAWCAEPVALPKTPVGRQTQRLLEVQSAGQRDRISCASSTS